MLIWKTKTLDYRTASLRYRCLLPARALEKKGIHSVIYEGSSKLPLHSKIEALIFVKSFTNEDLKTCQTASRLGIPVVLDLCDNIFIDNYGEGSKRNYEPRENFRTMARLATAIVTTGPVLKQTIEDYLETFCPVWIIPDGCETLEDVQHALQISAWQRWLTLLRYDQRGFALEVANHVTDLLRNLFDQVIKKVKSVKKRVNKNLVRTKKRIKKKIKQVIGSIKRVLRPVKRYFFQESSQSSVSLEQSSLSTPDRLDLKGLSQADSQEVKIDKETACLRDGSEDAVAQYLAEDSSRKPPQALTKIRINSLEIVSLEQATNTVRTILWFGHHGSSYSQSGIVNLLEVADAIEALSRDIRLRLLVVSNSYAKYLDLIDPLPFSTAYAEWHPIGIYQYISASDVVIIPNSKTAFALSKSANRAVLALSLGVPVVATRIPSMKPLSECMLFDDWESGLRQYLTQPDLVSAHLQTAQTILQTNYQSEAIAEQWAKLLTFIHKEPHAQSQSTL